MHGKPVGQWTPPGFLDRRTWQKLGIICSWFMGLRRPALSRHIGFPVCSSQESTPGLNQSRNFWPSTQSRQSWHLGLTPRSFSGLHLVIPHVSLENDFALYLTQKRGQNGWFSFCGPSQTHPMSAALGIGTWRVDWFNPVVSCVLLQSIYLLSSNGMPWTWPHVPCENFPRSA